MVPRAINGLLVFYVKIDTETCSVEGGRGPENTQGGPPTAEGKGPQI